MSHLGVRNLFLSFGIERSDFTYNEVVYCLIVDSLNHSESHLLLPSTSVSRYQVHIFFASLIL